MVDMMLLDVQPALSLRQRMAIAADELDFDAQALAEPMAEASELLGGVLPEVIPRVQRAAAHLRSSADDLNSRIRMVLANGPDMNAGLAALERIRTHFTTIESRGDPSRADGVLSRRDLTWASHQLDEETSAAASWLLEHEDFFDRVETAKHNDDYTSQPYDDEFAYDPEDRDGLLSLDDIDAFVVKSAARATLAPYAEIIDTGRSGGEPDGKLSRKDFEAFLSDYDISPEVTQAVRQVLEDGAYYQADSRINWRLALDGLSVVPVIGDVVDGGRAIYYSLHGDWTSAAIYGLGLVPLPGLSGSGVKAGYTVVKATVRGVQKSGYRKAARETGKVLYKGTSNNLTANTLAEAAADRINCSATFAWIASESGLKINGDPKKTTGENIDSITNRLSDATGYDLGVADGFFSDSCEVIARRLGEHKFSKSWLPS